MLTRKMEHLLLATHQRDIGHRPVLAEAHRAGIEVQVYGHGPDLLHTGWAERELEYLERCRRYLGS